MGRIYRVGYAGALNGSLKLQGAKNSVLKLMAATVLAEGTHRIGNVPLISDVDVMREILHAIGAESSWTGPHELEITVPSADRLSPYPPVELVGRIRASIVLAGPLLAVTGRARLAAPGGDDFGTRPIDIHEDALQRLGASFEYLDDYLEVKAPRLEGAGLVFEFPSHTATDNAIMAAVLARGTTVIENAAREPEVVDLAAALAAMGARIEGAGTSRIVIEGVDRLSPMDHDVVGDRVVAATYLTALGMAGGRLALEGIDTSIMEILIRKLGACGVSVKPVAGGLVAEAGPRPRAADIQTLPYPGVATDYKPMLVAMLSRAEGVSVVSENLFSGRFRYLDELRRLGADLISEGHHVVVRGVPRLVGGRVQAYDIRAGAALVVGALGAENETVITGVEHIERGYDGLVENLAALGADISVEEE